MERVIIDFTNGDGATLVDVTNPMDNRKNTAFVVFDDEDTYLPNVMDNAEFLVQEWLENGAEGCEYYNGATSGKSFIYENGIVVELCLP